MAYERIGGGSMVVAQATGGAYALSLALLIAVIYLAVVRLYASSR